MADERQLPEQDSEEELELSSKEPRFTGDEVNAAEAQIVEQTKRIDFYITEYSVELLANKMKSGDFLVPSYQREFTWEHERRTRFIESLLMGLPIPFLIFWTDPKTGVLEIVDGSQRLRTIQEFLLGDMVLGDLEELSRLVGFRFRDLPLSRQRKIKNLSIRGIILNQHADEQARFDVFERVNTGSKTANTAEVRRGALGGLFLDLVRKLAKDPLFVSLAPMSRTQRDLRQDEELVTRFFAYGDGLDGYEDRVSPFLYAYTKRMNTAFSADAELSDLYEARFQATMQFVAKHFPFGFRRMKGGASTPKARFEAIAVGSYLAISISPNIAERQDLAVEGWISEDEFKTVAGSGSANAVGKLRGRMNFVRDKLLGH
jgi:hypothetical protein